MSDFAVQAVGWRVIVEPIEIARKSAGGIDLPEETVRAQEYLRFIGEVVSIGPGAYQADQFMGKPWCKPGDMVVFGRHAGQEIPVKKDGKIVKMRIMNDDEILGLVTDADQVVTPM